MKCKSRFFQMLKVLIIISSSVIIFSCQESDIFEKKILERKLNQVFDNVKNNNFKLKEKNYQIINVDYFSELSKIKATNEKLKENSISKIANLAYKRNNPKIKSIEKIILTNYFNALELRNLNSVDITQYYIEKIANFNIDIKIKEDCINFLIFNRDLMIFINYNADVNMDSQSLLKRGCLDQCMFDKAKAVWVDGNWVDKTRFVLTAASTTAWWLASCSWNCAIK